MKKYKIAATEEWVRPHSLDLSDLVESSSPFYFILVDYQEMVLEDRICRYKRTVEKINDESRLEDASLYINDLQDEDHQIVFHSVDIIRDGKRFSVLRDEKISINQREISLESHITDQTHTVSFSIDDLRAGDIVDYQATTIIYAGEHPLSGKFYHTIFWLDWNCPVFRQLVLVINKSKKNINIQQCIMRDGLPQSDSEVIHHNKSFEKEYSNISPAIIDNAVPNWLWPDFLLATTQLEWSDLSSYLYNYYKSQKIFGSEISLDDISDISFDEKPETNIIKIVRFVQNNIRYKGENHGVFTHTPKQPDLILKNRYGDCKDKANLLVSLLGLIDVKANLTLVNTDYGIKINQLNPSPYHFNHMIVHIEYKGNEYYFDPTIKKQSGDLQHCTTLDYGYGLVLSEKGRPIQKLQHNASQRVFLLKHVFDFSKSSSSENTISINRIFNAHRADNIRYYLNSKEKTLLADEYLKSAIEDTELELSVEKPISIIRDDAQLNEIETEEIYSINNLTDDDDNRLLHIPTNIYLEFPTTMNNDQPLRIDLDGEVIHNIEVIYKGVAPDTSGEKFIKNKWFTYRDSISTKGSVIYFTATAVPHKRHVETKSVNNYLNDVEEMRQRSVNSFPYKSGDFTLLNSVAGRMFFGAFVLFVILLIIQKLN